MTLLLMVVMVALSVLLLLLLLLELSTLIPPVTENLTLSQLLDLLIILGHKRIGLPWSRISCFSRGWWLVLVWNHKALLHRP